MGEGGGKKKTGISFSLHHTKQLFLFLVLRAAPGPDPLAPRSSFPAG